MKEKKLRDTLTKIIKIKEKAKKDSRYYDETMFRCIELKIIKKIKEL